MKTINQLQSEMLDAQQAYLRADIEHPTSVLLAKEALSNARHEYWAACASFVTRISLLADSTQIINLVNAEVHS